MDPPPPPYEQAVRTPAPQPAQQNGISPSARRSMEDEARPLPSGWVRCFDPHYAHQYFVDTTTDPPRSIWRHPYDDKVFLDSLPPAERDELHQQGLLGHPNHPRTHDVYVSTTDEEPDDLVAGSSTKRERKSAFAKFERKVKDRLTHSTHAERQARRRRRAEEEQSGYQSYRLFRRKLEDAMRTGEPQELGLDDDGREVYLQPPGAVYMGQVEERRLGPYVTEVVYGPGAGTGVGLGGNDARFVKADGIYGHEGGKEVAGFPGTFGYGSTGGFARPSEPYHRPPGQRSGGGAGLPFALPLLGGLMLGGMMI
ncbi:hypothetical protein GE09DRAFT_284455 [Coniochaeta sp. 2T2.1]|nr:hypothetical protein GE09DRAFT_284455 [Coniochaeta sp. 2T2.1]